MRKLQDKRGDAGERHRRWGNEEKKKNERHARGRPGCQNKTGSDAVDLLWSFPHNHIQGLQRTLPKKEGKQFNGGQSQYVMEIALLLPEVIGQN